MKALIALSLLLLAPASADWTNEVTPPRLGTHPRLAPRQLDYQLSWRGMLRAGELRFILGGEDPGGSPGYHASATGGSRGLAARLHPYQIHLRSLLDPATLRPRSFVGIEDEGKEV